MKSTHNTSHPQLCTRGQMVSGLLWLHKTLTTPEAEQNGRLGSGELVNHLLCHIDGLVHVEQVVEVGVDVGHGLHGYPDGSLEIDGHGVDISEEEDVLEAYECALATSISA